MYHVLVFLCLLRYCTSIFQTDSGPDHTSAIFHVNNRDFLLSFKDFKTLPNNLSLHPDIPLRSQTFKESRTNKKKKRGSRGGILERLKRRGSRFPLPTITFSNCRSIYKKQDEITTLVQHDKDFRRCNLMCYTETWLDENKTLDITGYTAIRADRDNTKAQKKGHGGGVCFLVSDTWCTHFNIREQHCTKDYEILTVSFRPFYLPREFGQITIILAYIPGVSSTNYEAAGERLAESYHAAVARSADQPIFMLGDFNQLKIQKYIPGLHQYVSVSTRLSTILDKCFGNIQDAFISRSRPALGLSDHNVIHLLPKYRQKVKTEKPKTVTKQIWNKDSEAALQNCFEVTDWQIFIDSCSDPNELVNTITGYIQFCEQNVIQTKEVKMFSNNKPWLTKNLKKCLIEKNWAHIQGRKQDEKQLSKEFDRLKTIEKRKYRDKVQKKV